MVALTSKYSRVLKLMGTMMAIRANTTATANKMRQRQALESDGILKRGPLKPLRVGSAWFVEERNTGFKKIEELNAYSVDFRPISRQTHCTGM